MGLEIAVSVLVVLTILFVIYAAIITRLYLKSSECYNRASQCYLTHDSKLGDYWMGLGREYQNKALRIDILKR